MNSIVAEKLLLSSMSTMALLGSYTGYKVGKNICFQNKQITYFEKIGEYFCFSLIILSNSFLYAGLTPMILVTLPISIPSLVYNTLNR